MSDKEKQKYKTNTPSVNTKYGNQYISWVNFV